METIITAVGPDNVGLADPIVHFVTGQGANIEEIQMYNHDEAALFAMLLRIALPPGKYGELCDAMRQIGQRTQPVDSRLVAGTPRPASAAGRVDDPSDGARPGAAARDPRRPDSRPTWP